jgi:hypothetical protein
MERVRLFFKSMFSELGSGLSGPASVPFAIASLWVTSQIQRVLYGSLAGILLMLSAYRIWVKQNARAEKAEAELVNLKGQYFDEQPKLSMEILCTEGMKTWMEMGDPVQFYLRHLSGRVATDVRFDPILSKLGKFSLCFEPLPHVVPQVRLVYEVQDVGAPSLGYKDRDKIGNVSKELLGLFLLDSPKEAGEVEYPVTAHYKDNNTKRSHTFYLRFDQHRFRFLRNTA